MTRVLALVAALILAALLAGCGDVTVERIEQEAAIKKACEDSGGSVHYGGYSNDELRCDMSSDNGVTK